MAHRYATYSRSLRWVLWIIDRIIAWIPLWRPGLHATAFGAPESITRILVCNQGHLGDAILATAVIPVLRRAYPQAKLGFLVHPDARQVVDVHPEVLWVHTVEHWHLNRRDRSWWQRLRRHRHSQRAALAAIRALDYQLAIDLHPYFPNAIPLLARTGIDRRLGWSSAGFGALLTDAIDDDGTVRHMLERHAVLLTRFGIAEKSYRWRPSLALSTEAQQHWMIRARQQGIGSGYVALHVGAHAARRRWSADQWAAVACELVRHQHTTVLLGHGPAEQELCRQVAARCPQVIDLSGQLDWTELVAAIAACRLLLSHDSAATHVAAAFDKPRICIAAGIHDLRVWLKASTTSLVMMKPVPCAPCGRSGGCVSMDCLRGVPTASVVTAALGFLAP